MFILSSADFCVFQITFKRSYRNTIIMSNSLDPDQAGCFLQPDLGPNCLKLSSDNTGRQRVNKAQIKMQKMTNFVIVLT